MSAIIVENLAKRYVIGHEIRHDSFRDLLSDGVASLWSRLRQRARARAGEEFWALRDVSFSVEPGEVLGIIGRNGAGKSTLLKILSRITEPTQGRVRLRGRVASLLEVGTGFHPELTGRENIFLNGAVLGMSRAEIRLKFDAIVAFAEIDRFLDTPVKRYSSGMYVRLAFAVAAHLEPEILIVDEVLAVGDAAFQRKCIGKMQTVSQEEGRTVLFVSHNLKAIEHFCTRGLLLESGRLEASGAAAPIVSEYLRRTATTLRLDVALSLCDELDLVSLRLTPSAIRARDPLNFELVLATRRDCEITDLHLLLYNSFGERVTIVDLRDAATPGGVRRFAAGQRLRYAGRVDRIPLVDGAYRGGFCVRTTRHFLARYDLVELNIGAADATGHLLAYAPEYQGTTLLDFRFDVEVT